MYKFHLIFPVAIAFAIVMLFNTASGDVTVDPHGFAVQVEPEDILETEVTLHNSGDDEVGYRIRWASVRREEEEQRGPQRDDPGDVLSELELEHPGALGIGRDFENDLMWVTHTIIDVNGAVTDGFFTCYRVVGDEVEVVEDIHPNVPPLGGCYYDGILYATSWMNMWVGRWNMDGDNLGNIDVNGYVMACAVDPEHGYLFVIVYEHVDIYVLDINDDFNQVGVIEDVLEHGADIDFRGRIFWAPEHENGHLWLSYEWQAYQLNIDDDWNWEIVQEGFDIETDGRSPGIGHDGRDLWIGSLNSATIAITDDGINEPHWFTADPEEGVIAGGEDETIGILVTPGEEIDAGVYEVLMRIELDDEQQPRIEIAAVMSVSSPVAQLSGTVVDPSNNDEAIEGVKIDMDYYIMSRYTDEDGAYSFDNLPLREYEFSFSAPDFLPTVETLNIDEEGDIELDIELLHAVFSPSRVEFITDIEPDCEQTFDLIVTNTGNGPLAYTVERRLLGGADAEPWELRASLAVEELVDDDMINGVTFADGHFYVSGGNNGGNPSLIYVFDREGEQTSEFEQVHESRYGMRDLTYDGELIWGSDENVLYGYTTDGEHVETLEGEAQSYRSVTWDPVNERFWSADITSN
ncbi:carboxypeptidase regulatory-like domain-containing protein, partial [bacterium]|nr:carboxypeptidase regulatory-like domain-containing protein [bacterium]